MRRDASSPEAYLEDVGGSQRELLEAVRSAILETDANIEEGLRYGMLDYAGLANLAAQKRTVSLYVASEVLADYADEFAGVDRGKSCLRFERLEQVDRAALARLLRDVRRFRVAKARS